MKFLTTFSLCFFAFLAFGQTPHDLIPRELFFQQKDKVNVQLSLNGNEVFYQKNGVAGAGNSVFYVAAKSPLVERSIDFEGEVVDFRPVHDEGLVAVIQKDTLLQVCFTTPASQSVRQLELFPFQRMQILQLSQQFPNKIIVDITAMKEGKNGIYALDLLSGSTRRLGSMDGFSQVFFDQNLGKVAALQRNDLGGNTLLRYHEGSWQGVRKYPFHPEMFIGGLSRIISVSSDGKTIYATDNLDKDKTSLVSIDVGTGEVTELANDELADVLPYAATISPAGKPQAVVALWGDSRRHFLDEKTKADFAFLEKEIGGNLGFVEASADGNVWLLRRLDGGPQAYFHFDRQAQKVTELFNDYSHLDGHDLATRKAFTVTVRDGMKLPVHLYVPPGMAKADGTPRVPLPTIVYIHGGPWAGVTHWNGWFHTRNFQLLANRGYAVIHMEFRGTTGLGKACCDAGNLQWGEAMHHDIVDVVEWAVDAGYANRKRLGIWGWSYGGYATNYALGASPDLFACGVSMYGIADLHEFTKLPFADNDLWRSRVGDPNTDEGTALLKKHSPTTYIEQIKSPILLTTGSLDERIPQAHVDRFAQQLADAGKEVVYFYYPEEGHDYRHPESWISFWAIAEDLLHRHVGGRKQPVGMDLKNGNFKPVFGEAYIEGLE